MGQFPQQFGQPITDFGRLSQALQQNFLKAATEEYVDAYVEAASGLLIPKSIGDAKGDLIGFSSADTPVRIAAAASDGCVLTSDTTQTGGAGWSKPWHVISERATRYGGGLGTTNAVIGYGGAAHYLATTGSSASTFWLDPTEWSASGIILKLFAWCQTEADPADSTLTFGTARVTGIGAAGTIAASTGTTPSVALSVTAANTQYSGESSEVTVTTAGRYLIYFGHNVNPAADMSYGYTLLGRPAGV